MVIINKNKMRSRQRFRFCEGVQRKRQGDLISGSVFQFTIYFQQHAVVVVALIVVYYLHTALHTNLIYPSLYEPREDYLYRRGQVEYRFPPVELHVQMRLTMNLSTIRKNKTIHLRRTSLVGNQDPEQLLLQLVSMKFTYFTECGSSE